MKNFLFVLLMVFVSPAMATTCEINYSGLDDSALAKIKVACEQARLEQINKAKAEKEIVPQLSAISPDTVSAVGTVSLEIAKAIGQAARELNIAVNDFIQTPAGILVVVGVFWKLFLIQTIGILCSITVLVSTGWLVRRTLIQEYHEREVVRFWGLYTVIKRAPIYSSIANMNATQGYMLFWTMFFGGAAIAILLSTMVS